MGADAETMRDPRACFRWLHRLVLEGDERLRPVAPVEEALGAPLSELGASVRRSVWHMTYAPAWQDVRQARALAEAGRRPGIDGRYVTTPHTVLRLPLLTSHHVGMRLAPVIAPLLVVDARTVFVGGPVGHDTSGTVWCSTVPHVVAAAVACFDAVWTDSEPALPPGQALPFTPRMVEIGFHLTDGASDREIARELHLSQRTISAEVAEIVRRLGARNRAHAIALISTGTY